eukprot:jgi/Mesvir1/29115/Mv25744-RA.1
MREQGNATGMNWMGRNEERRTKYSALVSSWAPGPFEPDSTIFGPSACVHLPLQNPVRESNKTVLATCSSFHILGMLPYPRGSTSHRSTLAAFSPTREENDDSTETLFSTRSVWLRWARKGHADMPCAAIACMGPSPSSTLGVRTHGCSADVRACNSPP